MRERTLIALGERTTARLDRGDALEDARVTSVDRSRSSPRPLFAGSGAVDVVLDDRIVRYFVATVPDGTASLAELRRVAGVRFEELFALDRTGFEVCGDWRVAGTFLCCAMPRTIKQLIHDSVVSIAPLFVRVLNGVHPRAGWIVVRAHGWVTCAHFESDAIRVVRSTALDAMQPLESWLTHLALVSGLAVGAPRVLDADQPHLLPTDWHRIDQERRDLALLASLRVEEVL
jgi:hypothetical protein